MKKSKNQTTEAKTGSGVPTPCELPNTKSRELDSITVELDTGCDFEASKDITPVGDATLEEIMAAVTDNHANGGLLAPTTSYGQICAWRGRKRVILATFDAHYPDSWEVEAQSVTAHFKDGSEEELEIDSDLSSDDSEPEDDEEVD